MTITYLHNWLPYTLLGGAISLHLSLNFLVFSLPPHVFGCSALVHEHSPSLSKLTPSALKRVLVGYLHMQKGYLAFPLIFVPSPFLWPLSQIHGLMLRLHKYLSWVKKLWIESWCSQCHMPNSNHKQPSKPWVMQRSHLGNIWGCIPICMWHCSPNQMCAWECIFWQSTLLVEHISVFTIAPIEVFASYTRISFCLSCHTLFSSTPLEIIEVRLGSLSPVTCKRSATNVMNALAAPALRVP